MVVFPNAKINLGLHITRKRADGYHDLETVFYPLPLKDILEIVRLDNRTEYQKHSDQENAIFFTSSGLTVDGEPSQNLCVKAWQLLKEAFPALPAVQLHLHKNIPMGAGLGGGSADAAFTLLLLNQKFNLQLSEAQLIDAALKLGSDCPFFIINKPCLAGSRGENLLPVQLDLSNYYFVIINPGIHVSTAWAFAQITPKIPALPIADIISLPVTQWKDLLKNDFEAPVMAAYPAIEQIKTSLYDQGALYASMTGSGSSVFGIFESKPEKIAGLPENYFIQVL